MLFATKSTNPVFQFKLAYMRMESEMELSFMDDKVSIIKGDWVQTYTVEGYDKWDYFYLFENQI